MALDGGWFGFPPTVMRTAVGRTSRGNCAGVDIGVLLAIYALLWGLLCTNAPSSFSLAQVSAIFASLGIFGFCIDIAYTGALGRFSRVTPGSFITTMDVWQAATYFFLEPPIGR